MSDVSKQQAPAGRVSIYNFYYVAGNIATKNVVVVSTAHCRRSMQIWHRCRSVLPAAVCVAMTERNGYTFW